MSLNRIYIDGFSFAQPKKSGIGHIAEGLLLALEKEIKQQSLNSRIYIVVAYNKRKFVQKYVSDIVFIKTIPLPARIFNQLNNYNLLPPLDILLGRGSYIFPNYRNWPLAFSKSYTYVHDLSFILYPDFTEPKNLSYLTKHIQKWIQRSDAVITASEYTKSEISETFTVDKGLIKVIPHGVTPPDKQKYTESFIASTLKKYAVPYAHYVLVVGNIEPRKNIVHLIDAYEKLPKKLRDTYGLVIVGGGGWKSEPIAQRIDASIKEGFKIFRPKGYVSDDELHAFYAQARLLAMPSFYEGFGLPPLQAMSWGVPTVIANTSSLAELFGKASYVIDPKDISNISAVVQQALSDKTNPYQQEAEKVVAAYSWENTAIKMLEVLNEKTN